MSIDGRSRVPILGNVRKTIQDIREITGKQHTDDEIYVVLSECSMDPNETAQKLLYLDTFHEVRRRRDRMKEGFSNRALEDSRLKQGGKGRRGKGASAGYSSNLSDGGSRRNLGSRKENGVNHIAERGHEPSTRSVLHKTKNNAKSQATRVSGVASSGPANQSSANSTHGSAELSVISSGMNASKGNSAVSDTNNVENIQPQATAAAGSSPIKVSGSVTCMDQGESLSSSYQLPTSASVVYSSSSDPLQAPSIFLNPGVNGTVDREVGTQRISAVDLQSSKSEKFGSMKSTSKSKAPNKLNEVEKNHLSETSLLSSSLLSNGSLKSSSSCGSQPLVSETANASEASEVCVQSSAVSRQHVTFPNHLQVPETLKSGLTFGSFDNSGPRERSSGGTSGDNNNSASLESSPGNDEAVTSGASVSAQGDHTEHSHSTSYPIEKTSNLENSVSVSDSNSDQPKQEVLLAPEAPPIPNIHNTQNFDLNFMSSVLGTQQVQIDGAESQVHETSQLPNFVGASSPQPVSSTSPTTALQSSMSVSPQSVLVFRPPYHPNFLPYGHYYPPIYMSPMHHQYLSHNGFPQQPSSANMYLPATAPGIKYPFPQFKGGANLGNTAHYGIPSGSFVPPPVGYAPSSTVNTGSSTGSEDRAGSPVNENPIYTTRQPSEGSGVWVPASGQDVSSLQLSSMYNLTPHPQGHLTFPPTQTSRGAFAGLYQPGPAIASPSTFLQQSQAVVEPIENVGPHSSAYQQPPHHAHINWNSNF